MSVKKIGINDIVDDIVNQNIIEFDKKSKKQQNSQKEQISDTIKLALAGRNNNEERQTILIEISKSVNSYSQSFFDSNGNIDVSLLSEVTKSTVKNAEERGIINPVGQTVEKGNKSKINLTEVALTAVVIDKMINDYEKLSNQEKKQLISEFRNMDRDQQIKMLGEMNKDLDKFSKNAKSEEERNIYENVKKINEDDIALKKAISSGKRDDILDVLKRNPAIIKFYNIKNPNETIDVKDIDNLTSDSIKIIESLIDEVVEIANGMSVRINELMQKDNLTEKEKNEVEELKRAHKEIFQYKEKDRAKDENDFSNGRELESQVNNQLLESDDKSSDIQNRVYKFTCALEKYSYGDDIKEAFDKYTDYFASIDDETISLLKQYDKEELNEILKEEFEEVPVEGKNTTEILNIMLTTFGDDIKEILVNNDTREQFFYEFEKAKNMDLEKIDRMGVIPIQDESFTEFYDRFQVEMDVSAIERQAEKEEIAEPFEQSVEGNEISGLNQDIVANIFDGNMESVSDEDNATQGSTSSGAKKFSVNDVKAVASGVKMPEIQDSTKLIYEVLNEKSEREEEQEVQTV